MEYNVWLLRILIDGTHFTGFHFIGEQPGIFLKSGLSLNYILPQTDLMPPVSFLPLLPM
jgi:hypothetical protein